jgi:hypothetical protein
MKKVLKIDNSGLFIEDVLIEDDEITPSDCIETECPNGFYKPKWNGAQWAEGLTQAEIDAIKNTPIPKTDEEKLKTRIDAVENALMLLI